MILETPSRTWSKMRPANSTDASYPARIPTVTQPTGTGVISPSTNSIIRMLFFGAGSDGQLFDAQVIGWNKVADVWVPTTLATIRCTLGTLTGVTGQLLSNTDRLCKTTSLVSGDATSQVGNGQASVDLRGSQLVEVIFNRDNATSSNALYYCY